MSDSLPKSFFSSGNSAFAVIDPTTGKFHRRLDRHGFLTSGLGRHVAISYVWSEWKRDPAVDRLPDWEAVRSRLSSVVGSTAPKNLRPETGSSGRCWIDCKCIDQSSDTDKAYWIPRMDEIYSEARCTVLLLRHVDLTPLQELAGKASCQYKGRLNSVDELLAPHNCLLNQGSCTELLNLGAAEEQASLDCLKSLATGQWRRRAWVLQEILLSENYLLSWGPGESGWMRLEDAGVIADSLFRRHGKETWLGEFANWCRRLWYLRQNYGEAQKYELCDGNVLQLSTQLEATVPADKFYALCGVLRLKSVGYDAKHTANEALQNVVGELVRNGRLSWMYAIRPVMTQPTTSGSAPLRISSESLGPFVLLRLKSRLMANKQKMEMTESHMTVKAIRVGTVSSTSSLRDYLSQATALTAQQASTDGPPSSDDLFMAPAVARRLAIDVVEPLLATKMLEILCEGLGIPNDQGSRQRAASMLMGLYSHGVQATSPGSSPSGSQKSQKMALAASWSLQRQLAPLLDEFQIVRYSSGDQQEQSLNHQMVLGSPIVTVGSIVYAVKGDEELLFAASESVDSDGSAAFQGMILQLQAGEALGPVGSSLFTSQFWIWKKQNEDQATQIKFRTIV
ncbi:unnamed protein product [Clonostachys byssicola]|uniref:Heterokaryon incompatibility domain-containing protein n=1 Tax=Clonostachys byssicola TaxID=160290 RepID=A0A9N9UHZ0_9HYPO|nr:unnamed protein product [Clonostachys byssicola]